MALDGIRDFEIRRALRSMVEARHDPSDTRVVDELEVCQGIARVDLAVVNGVLHGYEIKSDADSLVRLPGQVEAYGRVLELMTIVCGRRHLAGIRRIVPKWWGILVAEWSDVGVRLMHVRQHRRNPRVDCFAQAQLLWREEALAALEARELAEGLRTKPRRVLWRRLADQRPGDVSEVVRDSLKARQAWRVRSLPT